MLRVHRIQFGRKSALSLCGAIGLALLVAGQAWGHTGSTNYLTFSRSVALPGVVLPAGSYTFEVANPESSGNVVRVSSRVTGEVHFLGFTHRVERPSGLPNDRIVSFGEAAAGAPAPITAWYPLGRSLGHQFIYR